MSAAFPKWVERALVRSARFLRYVVVETVADDCPRTAAALAYETLLALVPLFAVALGAASAVPEARRYGEAVETFIFRSFVPEFGETVRGYLHAFLDQAEALRSFGMVALFVTAVWLLVTIENSLNAIWRAGHIHHRLRLMRLIIYALALTLGPLLIGIGLATTSYLVSLPMVAATLPAQDVEHALLPFLPYVTSFAAFSLLYLWMPNCKVALRHAAAGGAVASLMFELGKWAFTYYVTHFHTYATVYGAVAAVPLFLLWIYWCWLIVLAGAEFARCLDSFPAHAPYGA